jgi:ribose transport system ATP-binding protein
VEEALGDRLTPTSPHRGATVSAEMAETVVRVEGVSKTFPGQKAVDDVSLEVRAGEVHAIVGQNGSGKSTLMKILSGFHHADPGGRVVVLGEEVDPAASSVTRERLHFIHQDLGLVDSLDTVDNLGLGLGYAFGPGRRIRWRASAAQARATLRGLGMDFDVRQPVGTLSAVERTMVAVARATSGWAPGPNLLVLDEVAAALPLSEVETLFAAMRRLRDQGAGQLYISHRLGEVFEIADRVTVLRDGRLIATRPISELDHDELVRLIIGRTLDSVYVESPPARDDVVMSVHDLSAERIDRVSFTLHAGEMLGVTGLAGSGVDHLPEALVGATQKTSGRVLMDDGPVEPLTVARAKERGMVLVPANRAVKGCIPTQSVRWNLTLPRLGPLRRWFGLSHSAEVRETARWIERVDVRPPDQELTMAQLSGGNQQKVVIAKWLRTGPRVLVLHEPTHGVDIGARAAIWELLADIQRERGAVVICSTEIEDLAHVCDRVLVMDGGRVIEQLRDDALTEERIAAAILSTSSTSSEEPIVHGHD